MKCNKKNFNLETGNDKVKKMSLIIIIDYQMHR